MNIVKSQFYNSTSASKQHVCAAKSVTILATHLTAIKDNKNRITTLPIICASVGIYNTHTPPVDHAWGSGK